MRMMLRAQFKNRSTKAAKPMSARAWLTIAWFTVFISGMVLFNLAELVYTTLHLTWNTVSVTLILLLNVMFFLFIGYVIDRKLARPLTLLGQAAREIAAGRLDVALPTAGVREVVEVAEAFRVMRDGLQDSVAQQAKLEQERRLFISAVAHDLRTPLFALRGYLQGLTTGIASTPQRMAQYLAACTAQAAALDARVSDLFAYTRIEYLGQPLQREPVMWHQVWAEVIERLQPKAVARQIDLRTTAALDEPMTLAGDRRLLSRALENLIDNAIQYTPIEGTVTFRTWREADRVCFEIRDTGPGLKPTDALFEIDGARKTSAQGAGIGLLIAHRVMQAHGGQLVAERHPKPEDLSREGDAIGTTIRGWLPVAEALDCAR